MKQDGIHQHDDGLDAKLNESSITHLAIVLSYFFGKEGLSQFRLKLLISVSFLIMFAATVVLDIFTGSWVTQHLAIHSPFIDCAPFFLLSLLVMFRPKGIQTFFVLVVTNAVLGGLVVWFLGRSGTHHVRRRCCGTGCGAMIFTLFGYLLLVGAVRRDVRSAIVSIAVFVMYGGLLWALLPIKDREMSWESHLMGMVIGCVLGVYDARAGTITSEDDVKPTKQTVRSSQVGEKTGLTAKEIDESV